MKDAGSSGFERWLKSITLMPAPQRLRERVLKAAAQSREDAAWTTPLLRRWLVACAAVLLTIMIADGMVSKAQRNRLLILAGGPRPAPIQQADDRALLAEVLGDAAADKMVAMEKAAGRRRSVRKPAGDELRELELLMEGGDESQKDLH